MRCKLCFCSFMLWTIMQPGMLHAEGLSLDDLVAQFSQPANSPKSREAVQEIGNILRNGSPSDISAIQNRLCQEMASLSNYTTIRRICVVFAYASTEEAVSIVLDKLGNEATKQGKAVLCDGLGNLLDKKPVLQAATRNLIVSRLETILKDRDQTLRLIASAEIALAQLGSAGFDVLMQLKDDPEHPKIMNVFYTALGATDDPRAISVLRSTIVNETTPEGLQMQAIHALGLMFARLTSQEQTIESNEAALCVQALYPFLSDSVADQLFAVSLRSLGKMVFADKDPQVYVAVLLALRSENVYRREAALDVIYMTDANWDPDIMTRVKWISEFDPEGVCRSTAQAVIDKIAGPVEVADCP